MQEKSYPRIDAASKIITALAVLVGGLWAVYTYQETKERDQRTALVEARKPFEARRLELYLDLSTRATKLAEETDPKKFKEQSTEFHNLAIGPITVTGSS